jgi:glyoxylase-like metal-dependent hydrolase (beta-lactamase superfamily II)
MAPPETVAPGVYRLGSTKVNFYLVEEGGRFVLIDAGAPSFQSQLEPALSAAGGAPGDLAAVVLTHAHTDHTGFASKVHARGTPVYVHAGDRDLLATHKQRKREASMLPLLRRAAAWGTMAHLLANGAMRSGKVSDPELMEAGSPLELPGRLVPIHTPGHTEGHCALYFEGRRVLFCGDMLCTWNPFTGRPGPQLMPSALGYSTEESLRSLEAIEGLDVDVLLPGHGEPWTEGAAAAVAKAREAGPS